MALKWLYDIVTVQYPHGYEQKSNENRLWRWDFCVQPSGFWHIHAKTPRGTVASEQLHDINKKTGGIVLWEKY